MKQIKEFHAGSIYVFRIFLACAFILSLGMYTPVYAVGAPDLVITGYQFVDSTTGLPLASSPLSNQPFSIKVIVKNQGDADAIGIYYRSVFVNRDPSLLTITSPEGCLYDPEVGENDWGDYQKQNFNIDILIAGTEDTQTNVDIPGLSAGSYQIWLYADPTCIVQGESLEDNNVYGPITVNIGNRVDVNIGGNFMGSNYISSNPAIVRSYPNLMDGPTRITSVDNVPIVASQRALVDGFSFDEYMGLPSGQITNEYWFTWYDQNSPGLYTWILIGNPSMTTIANVEIFIDGVKRGDTQTIPPNGRITPTYPGVMGGPVLIKSDIPVFASERTIWVQNHNGTEIYAFNEVMGYPSNQLTNEYWFTWYDQLSADTYAWILVGNPNATETANVEIFIGGVKQGATHVIPPNGRITPSYPGVMAGPVQVKSDIPVFTSERVIAGTSFNEVMGYPANRFDNEYWYPWYDNVTMYTWLLVGNPSPTLTAEVDIYIGGTQQETRYTIPPNGRITPMYSGVNGGPVRVVSANGVDGVVDIFTSQRVVYLNGDKVGFNEVFGVPKFTLASAFEYWFTWYDNLSMISDLRIGRP